MKQNRLSTECGTRTLVVALMLGIVASGTGCGNGAVRSDAFGNFEATEVIVSAEASGRLVAFRAEEGEYLQAGAEIALVDTIQLSLRADQIRAQREAVRSRLQGVSAQFEVLQEQRGVAVTELTRVEALTADGAATQKQLDDVEGQIRVLDRQLDAIRAQNAPIFAEIDVLDAQL